jgi:sulfate adenylyltransferase
MGNDSEGRGLPQVAVPADVASDILNICQGVYSPLEGFATPEELEAILKEMRLPSGIPWTIPIVLDVDRARAASLPDRVLLSHRGAPLAVLDVTHRFAWNREAAAGDIFGTTDPRHPGVARMVAMGEILLAGPVTLVEEPPSPFSQYSLTPNETRVLFGARGWRTVVGFQTRNVPHLGHEYVQKTALTFVDGILIQPVIGRKKPGDFRDDVIIAAYERLVEGYYLRERAVLAILRSEMRYAGPREAVLHAIIRKNFGCTHFVVGRDHAGVGQFYAPYAAQEIFDRFPDLGIVPLFFTAFFHCRRCGSIVNEKTCPHGGDDRVDFSGTLVRSLVQGGEVPRELVRPEVAETIRGFAHPLVE